MMPQGMPEHIWKAVVKLSDCGTSAEQVRNALAAWVKRQKNGAVALRELTEWDRKLGVWCACAVVESALKHLPAGEDRPRIAIETARSWVLGQATVEQLRKAGTDSLKARHAVKAADASKGSCPYLVAAATNVTLMAIFEQDANAALTGSDVAKYVAQALPTYRERRAGLGRLRTVIAQAILNYPVVEKSQCRTLLESTNESGMPSSASLADAK